MSADPGKRLKVWVLSDGRAGHVNQSQGVLAAMRRWTAVDEEMVEVRLRAGLFRGMMGALLRAGAGRTMGLLPMFCRIGELPAGAPDLIVSAGGNTLHANAWLARVLGCRNLFCGDLRGLGREMFSGVITWDESKAGRDGWIVSATPVSIMPDVADVAAEAWREEAKIGREPLWTVLVGGEGAGYHWGLGDMEALAGMMTRFHEVGQVRWVVVTSRRTGKEAEAVLKAALSDALVAGWCVPDAPGAVPYPAALGAGERVFVTEDSHMMITEAIASGRPVHTVRPARCDPDQSNRHFLELYERQGWISRHGLDVEGELPELAVLREGTVVRLGRQLEDWWKGGGDGAV